VLCQSENVATRDGGRARAVDASNARSRSARPSAAALAFRKRNVCVGRSRPRVRTAAGSSPPIGTSSRSRPASLDHVPKIRVGAKRACQPCASCAARGSCSRKSSRARSSSQAAIKPTRPRDGLGSSRGLSGTAAVNSAYRGAIARPAGGPPASMRNAAALPTSARWTETIKALHARARPCRNSRIEGAQLRGSSPGPPRRVSSGPECRREPVYAFTAASLDRRAE
jgi:hypothetical protein